MAYRRDTIAAIATPPGRGSIGVVRVAGTDLRSIAQSLTGRVLVPRAATLTRFLSADGAAIDEGLALFFAAPQSYTGEDVLELHGHGGPVVLGTLLDRCIALGARIAEPGEFTRRAFLNGKLDLAQAEAVIDLIDSATTQAARCAVRSLQGDFSSEIRGLNKALIELRAYIEAMLDFPEEDLDPVDQGAVRARLEKVCGALDKVLLAAARGSVLREGLYVVLAGRPNVGKSSLLNRLAGEELAIVTEIPGTTRDPIRQLIDLSGVPMHLVDTAGLRETSDVIERIGVERAWTAIDKADLVLQVVDAQTGVTAEEDRLLARVPPRLPVVRVLNKIDLARQHARMECANAVTSVWVSAKTGEGLDHLRGLLLRQAGWENHPESAFLARERHLVALRQARDHLAQADGERANGELLAEELRLAQRELSKITGEYSSDDLLGEIFGRFCIGK